MATCEMCGEAADLKRTRVEDATLDLCEDCREVGEVVDTPSSGSATASTSSRPSTPDEDVLPGYGNRVKQAREARDLSVQALAEELKEKTSVVRRVESEKLTPDRGLAGKFERALDIEIYGTPPQGNDASSSTDSGGQTIGDVADVRRS
ncbi:MAG: multiprotein-bridging factor 1 family protein [Candidatus Nanohaloarchaea archaeon]|nr:multiprotein-bridging factor 1 family protein [Candidatus Nanohaloarchaea archaeon]